MSSQPQPLPNMYYQQRSQMHSFRQGDDPPAQIYQQNRAIDQQHQNYYQTTNSPLSRENFVSSNSNNPSQPPPQLIQIQQQTQTRTISQLTILPQQQRAPLRATQSPQLALSSSNSSLSVSPAPNVTHQPEMHQSEAQDVLKCSHFFKTLLKIKPQQVYNILDVRNLLREVVLGEQSPEEFTIKLREVTKSQDKGNLLPFLRRALPALRRSIQNGDQLELRQSLQLDDFSPTSLPTPPASLTEQYPHQTRTDSPIISQQLHASHAFEKQQILHSASPDLKQQIGPKTNHATGPPPKTGNSSTTNSNYALSEALDYENSVENAPSLVKMNLPQMLLNPQALADRILSHMPEADGVDPEVLSIISNAAEARIRSILANLSVLAEHRVEPLKMNSFYTAIDDPRKQLRLMEDIEKRAHESRQIAEKEALLKITKSKGKDKDTLEKAKQLQKADREAMVNREANAAAFAALGGTRAGVKRAVTDWKIGMQNHGLGSGLMGQAGRPPRVKRVTLRDLQFFLDSDPMVQNNSKLLHRIALSSLSVEENASI